MKRTLWIAMTGLLFAAAASCSMRGTTQAPPRISEYEARDTKHQEVLLWHEKIMEYRKELGLADLPSPHLIIHDTRIEPPPEPMANMSPQCLDVCDLAERICEAQKEICTISDELGSGDTWATEKCDSAKASCREAKKRCTDCRSGDSP